MKLGAASTGTVISSLSGAAATNATMAWLGGGAISAGGLGIAGGAITICGIVAGPALAIAGFMMASRAEEAITEAEAYKAKIEVAIAEMENVKVVLKAIRSSCVELSGVINNLAYRFDQVKVNDADDPVAFERMIILGKALKQALDIPVIQEDGNENKNLKSKISGCIELGNESAAMPSKVVEPIREVIKKSDKLEGKKKKSIVPSPTLKHISKGHRLNLREVLDNDNTDFFVMLKIDNSSGIITDFACFGLSYSKKLENENYMTFF